MQTSNKYQNKKLMPFLLFHACSLNIIVPFLLYPPSNIWQALEKAENVPT